MDSRLVYPSASNWRSATKQILQSTEFVTLDATNKSGNSYEFDLASSNYVLFGPCTGFQVTAEFRCKGAGAADEWEAVPLADYTKVKVQSNWFENIIQSIDIFHINSSTKINDTPPYVDTLVNTYLYAMMDKFSKKYLFPEACNPGNATFAEKGKWSLTEKSDWHTYSKTIFGQDTVRFRYIPMMWPFYQQKNFMVDGKPPNGLPMGLLNKIAIRVNFKDSTDHIFRKPADNTKKYKVEVTSLKFIYEEAKLNQAFEKSLYASKRLLPFSGVTRLGVAENIPSGVFNYRLRFQDILLPEQIFVFAIPKTVIGGQYKYSTDTSDDVFSTHNIKEIELAYGGMPFHLKSPNIGEIGNDTIEIQSLINHIESPPFGVLQDPALLTYETVEAGSANTPFPHVLINLCPSGTNTRLIPISDNGSVINTYSDLDVTLKFGTRGATSDVNYCVYACYTDINMNLDLRTLRFEAHYNRLRPNT